MKQAYEANKNNILEKLNEMPKKIQIKHGLENYPRQINQYKSAIMGKI